jgi:hypothetical protein
MFISGLPSSRAHFPYQVGLCGNRSPPDPLSLSARATCEPPHHRLAPAHPSRCCRPGRCLGLHPYVRLTGQPDPPPPSSPLPCAMPHTSPASSSLVCAPSPSACLSPPQHRAVAIELSPTKPDTISVNRAGAPPSHLPERRCA